MCFENHLVCSSLTEIHKQHSPVGTLCFLEKGNFLLVFYLRNLMLFQGFKGQSEVIAINGVSEKRILTLIFADGGKI